MNAAGVLVTRRQLLTSSAALVAAAATAAPTAPDAQLLELADGAMVVLHDRRLPLATETARRLAAGGARILALTDDPVRMWRSDGALAARDTRLLGVTRWPDFLLISGLATESRRHVRYQRLDASGSMVWQIF